MEAETWLELNSLPGHVGIPSRATALAIDPADPAVLYLGSQIGLHKSTDRGRTWGELTAPVGGGINSIALDPNDRRRLFVGSRAGVCRSDDGGSSWRRVLTDDTKDTAGQPVVVGVGMRRVVCIATSPSRTVVVTGGGGMEGRPFVHRSPDLGQTWVQVPDRVGPIHCLIADTSVVPAVLYAGTNDGVYRLVDAEAVHPWQPLFVVGPDQDLPIRICAVAVDPTRAIVYAGSRDNGVFRIDARSGHGKHVLAGGVEALAIDTRNPSRLVVALSNYGVSVTEDGGATWRANVGNGSLYAGSHVECLVLDPSDGVVYAGTDRYDGLMRVELQA